MFYTTSNTTYFLHFQISCGKDDYINTIQGTLPTDGTLNLVYMREYGGWVIVGKHDVLKITWMDSHFSTRAFLSELDALIYFLNFRFCNLAFCRYFCLIYLKVLVLPRVNADMEINRN